MSRIAISCAKILLAILPLPVAALIAPAAANAANPHMCETFGAYCVGSPDLNLYTRMEERVGGRFILPVPLGGSYEGHDTYELVLTGTTNDSGCVAASDSLIYAVIHPCNGGSGTVWALDGSYSQGKWINRLASQTFGVDIYLTGDGHGDDYFLDSNHPGSGELQSFTIG